MNTLWRIGQHIMLSPVVNMWRNWSSIAGPGDGSPARRGDLLQKTIPCFFFVYSYLTSQFPLPIMNSRVIRPRMQGVWEGSKESFQHSWVAKSENNSCDNQCNRSCGGILIYQTPIYSEWLSKK